MLMIIVNIFPRLNSSLRILRLILPSSDSFSSATHLLPHLFFFRSSQCFFSFRFSFFPDHHHHKTPLRIFLITHSPSSRNSGYNNSCLILLASIPVASSPLFLHSYLMFFDSFLGLSELLAKSGDKNYGIFFRGFFRTSFSTFSGAPHVA